MNAHCKALASLLAALPLTVSAADIFQTGFDSLTTGPLNGKGGWSAPAEVEVVNPGLPYFGPETQRLRGGKNSVSLDSGGGYATLDIPATIPENVVYWRLLFEVQEDGTIEAPSVLEVAPTGDASEATIYVDATSDEIGVTLGGSTVEMDSLAVEAGYVNVLVGRIAMSSGTAQSIDLWMNPLESYDSIPLLSADIASASLVASDFGSIGVRSAEHEIRIDQLKYATDWAGVVPQKSPFDETSYTFEGLPEGPLVDVPAWYGPSRSYVSSPGLVYSISGGETLDGGDRSLVLSGSPGSPMFEYARYTYSTSGPGETFYWRVLTGTEDAGTDSHPGQLLVQLHPGNGKVYAIIDFHNSTVSLSTEPGEAESASIPNLKPDEVFAVVGRVRTNNDGWVTGLDFWLDPVLEDAGSPDFSVEYEVGRTHVSELTQFRARSKFTTTAIDNLKVAIDWETVVPAPSVFEVVDLDFNALKLGPIDGQAGWENGLHAIVIPGGLNYVVTDGAVIDGGSNALALNGSVEDPMVYSVYRFPAEAPRKDVFFSLLAQTEDAGTEENPAQLDIFFKQDAPGVTAHINFQNGSVIIAGETFSGAFDPEEFTNNNTQLIAGALRINENSEVTSFDLWLNPAYGDDGSPDFSAELDEELFANDIERVGLRSRLTRMVVDEVNIATSWDTAVPPVSRFSEVTETFDTLTPGTLTAVGPNWYGSDAAEVVSNGLDYNVMDGGMINGGSLAAMLEGSAGDPMNEFASLIYPTAGPEQTFYFRTVFSHMGNGKLEVQLNEMPGTVGTILDFSAMTLTGQAGDNSQSTGITAGMGSNHLLLGRVVVDEERHVERLDLWVDPAYGNSGAPDLSVPLTGEPKFSKMLRSFRVRSGAGEVKLDEIVVTREWDKAVPPVPNFGLLDEDFNNLNEGPLDGQGGWNAPSEVFVVETALRYDIEEGGYIDGKSLSILLNGEAGDDANDGVATYPYSGTGPDKTFYWRTLVRPRMDGTADDPGTLEVQLHPFDGELSAMLNVVDDTISINGETVDAPLDIRSDQTYLFVGRIMIDESGQATSASIWINPSYREKSEPDLMVDITDRGLTGAELDIFRLHAENVPFYVDEVAVAVDWDPIVIPKPEFTEVDLTFNNLSNGPIDPADGWEADEGAKVMSGGLNHIVRDGGVIEGGDRRLGLESGAEADYTYPVQAPEATYYWRLLVRADANESLDLQLQREEGELGATIDFDSNSITLELASSGDSATYTDAGLETGKVHLIVGRTVVNEERKVTGIDMWLDPLYADTASPDLTLDLNEPYSGVEPLDHVGFKGSGGTFELDEWFVAFRWNQVVPLPAEFELEDQDLNDLMVGKLDNQANWLAPDDVMIREGTLGYVIEDGAVLGGGTNVMQLPAATTEEYAELIYPSDPPPASYYFRTLFMFDDAGSEDDPARLVVQLHPDNDAAAAVVNLEDETIAVSDGNGGWTSTEVDELSPNRVHMLVGRVRIDGDQMVSGMDLWLDPNPDDQSEPMLSADYDGAMVDSTMMQSFRIRSENEDAWADELAIGMIWEEIVPAQTGLQKAILRVAGADVRQGVPSYATAHATIDVSPAKSLYDAGEEVTLQVTPEEGYIFIGWDGDIESSSGTNPMTVELQGATDINAIIEELAITVSPQAYAAEAGGETFDIAVEANDVYTWSAMSNNDWLVLNDFTSSMGDDAIAVTVSPNPSAVSRTGTVMVAGVEVEVTQAGAASSFEVNPSALNASVGGESFSVEVIATPEADWNVSSDADWISISPMSGTGNATLDVTVAANSGAYARSATVSVGDAEIVVAQTGQIEFVFPNASEIGDGLYDHPLLGEVEVRESDSNVFYIRSKANGWWAALPMENEGEFWAWDYNMGVWAYYSDSIYPFLYIPELNGWAFVLPTEEGTRWFWSWNNNKWVSEDTVASM